MAFRKAFILGGAVVLAAACYSGPTAPTIRANGGVANAATATTDSTAKRRTTLGTISTMTASDSTCRSGYSVQSGRSDSTCIQQ